jgi:tetratricopeptide (TPR) repeat protein
MERPIMRMFALLLAGTVIAAGAAQAAVRVVGTTDAQACYMAAKAERASDAGVKLCTIAIESNLLSKRDLAATKVNRGILRMYDRDYAGALTDYDAAIALKPDMGEAHVNKAIAMLRTDQSQASAATQSLTRGLELGTAEPEVAHYMRAVAHEILGDAKAAYLDYKQAAELRPAWQDPQVALRRFTVTKASS